MMKKYLIFTFILLSLLPAFFETDFSTASAQNMTSEGYLYDCEDKEFGDYTSSLPCGEEASVTCCKICKETFPTNEFDGHICTCAKCYVVTIYDKNNPHVCETNNSSNDSSDGWNLGSNSSHGTAKSKVSLDKLKEAFKKRGYDRPYTKGKCGNCLRAWKYVWQDAGIGEYANCEHAKDFGPFLKKYGFNVIASGHGENRPSGYTPQFGDTRVWDTYPGQKTPSGHIDWWDGTSWCSDYRQGNDYWAPGPGYRNYNVEYEIYR